MTLTSEKRGKLVPPHEMEMRQNKIKMVLVLGILLLIAILFILYAVWPSFTGKTIYLETKPLDTNLIRGQYLNINYNINTIPILTEAKQGNEIYVTLQENKKSFWQYRSSSLEEPESGVFLKGKVDLIYGNNMQVSYGIEQYFIQQKPVQGKPLVVEAKVTKEGRARITKLIFLE